MGSVHFINMKQYMSVFFVNASLEKRTLKFYHMNNLYCCKKYLIQSLMHNVVADSIGFWYIPRNGVRRGSLGFIGCSEQVISDSIQGILG